MTYRGTVFGNVVVFPPGIELPEGLEVTVEPIIAKSTPDKSTESVLLRNGVPVYSVCDESTLQPGMEVVNALRDEVS